MKLNWFLPERTVAESSKSFTDAIIVRSNELGVVGETSVYFSHDKKIFCTYTISVDDDI